MDIHLRRLKKNRLGTLPVERALWGGHMTNFFPLFPLSISRSSLPPPFQNALSVNEPALVGCTAFGGKLPLELLPSISQPACFFHQLCCPSFCYEHTQG